MPDARRLSMRGATDRSLDKTASGLMLSVCKTQAHRTAGGGYGEEHGWSILVLSG